MSSLDSGIQSSCPPILSSFNLNITQLVQLIQQCIQIANGKNKEQYIQAFDDLQVYLTRLTNTYYKRPFSTEIYGNHENWHERILSAVGQAVSKRHFKIVELFINNPLFKTRIDPTKYPIQLECLVFVEIGDRQMVELLLSSEESFLQQEALVAHNNQDQASVRGFNVYSQNTAVTTTTATTTNQLIKYVHLGVEDSLWRVGFYKAINLNRFDIMQMIFDICDEKNDNPHEPLPQDICSYKKELVKLDMEQEESVVIHKNSIAIVRFLIDKGYRFSIDSTHATLKNAAIRGHLTLIRLLMEHKPEEFANNGIVCNLLIAIIRHVNAIIPADNNPVVWYLLEQYQTKLGVDQWIDIIVNCIEYGRQKILVHMFQCMLDNVDFENTRPSSCFEYSEENSTEEQRKLLLAALKKCFRLLVSQTSFKGNDQIFEHVLCMMETVASKIDLDKSQCPSLEICCFLENRQHIVSLLLQYGYGSARYMKALQNAIYSESYDIVLLLIQHPSTMRCNLQIMQKFVTNVPHFARFVKSLKTCAYETSKQITKLLLSINKHKNRRKRLENGNKQQQQQQQRQKEQESKKMKKNDRNNKKKHLFFPGIVFQNIITRSLYILQQH
jgi:hypothetical protein